jgi:succinate dehydrogenase / fumarate reductase cytochrome b subunit
MENVLQAPARSRLSILWSSTVGRKVLMAATGLVLTGFVIVHMLGNLQFFAGSSKLDQYAELLRASPPVLWTARLVLLASAIVHAWAGISLYLRAKKARGPVGYAQLTPVVSSAASRSMFWSGLLILLFVVFHLLDLTLGPANPGFVHGEVFDNVVRSLSRWTAAVAYLVAMGALGFHLWHGVWSMFQTFGLSNARLRPGYQQLGAVVSVLLAIGFALVPAAVVTGLYPR